MEKVIILLQPDSSCRPLDIPCSDAVSLKIHRATDVSFPPHLPISCTPTAAEMATWPQSLTPKRGPAANLCFRVCSHLACSPSSLRQMDEIELRLSATPALVNQLQGKRGRLRNLNPAQWRKGTSIYFAYYPLAVSLWPLIFFQRRYVDLDHGGMLRRPHHWRG